MRNLVAQRVGRAYTVLRDGKPWFSHTNPNTFRGMVVGQCTKAEIEAMQAAQAQAA